MEVHGYIRVSSREQNEDSQLIALKEVGIVGKIFILIRNREKILSVRNIKNCCES